MAVIPLKLCVKLLPDGTHSFGARFEIERVLSADGFGITYLARDFQFEDTCVVKELALGEIVGRDTTRGTLQPLPSRQADVANWVDKVVREARLPAGAQAGAVATGAGEGAPPPPKPAGSDAMFRGEPKVCTDRQDP